MNELLQAAAAPANIIPTALLAFVLLYWLVVLVGLIDLDFINIEVETDGEPDVSGTEAIVWLNSALAFFNLGQVPFMLFLSFLVLPFWAIALLANYYLGTGGNFLGFLLLLPALIAALFISKILTTPFVKLFCILEKEHDSNAVVIGQVCTITLPASPTELGQATVKTEGSPLLLNVKTTGSANIRKGETALVIDYDEKSKYYLIEPYQLL
jgi:hypothetical protein